MHTPVSKRARWIAAAIFHAALIGSAARPVSAQAKPISQTRINEYAATLLKVHRALIEDTGLRRPGEQLGAYVERLLAPVPGESAAKHIVRQTKYVDAFKILTETNRLCTAVPLLHDNTNANHQTWKRAITSSAQLRNRFADMVTVESSLEQHIGVEKYSGASRDRALATEMTKTLLLLKTAFEALREARP